MNQIHRCAGVIRVAACAASLSAAAGLAHSQTLSHIAPTPPYTGTASGRLSGNGLVVGGWQTPGNNTGFRWTVAGGMSPLPAVPGYVTSFIQGVSQDGSALAINGWNNGGFAKGVRWTQAGGFQDPGFLPGGTWQEVSQISADGLTLVGSAQISGGANRAYRWSQAGGMQSLGVLAGGFNSQAAACTPNGSIVVGSSNYQGPSNRPFRWTQSTGMQALLAMPANCTSGSGICVSDNGDTLLCQGQVSGLGRSYLWKDLGGGNGAAIDLGVNAPYQGVFPQVLSRDGSVAGGFQMYSGGIAAYIWTSELGLRDLSTFLSSVGFNLSGWSAFTAFTGISDDGRTLMGHGTYQNHQEIFVARNVPCLNVPQLVTEPGDQIVCEGTTVGYTAAGGGTYTGTLTYRWHRNGVPMNDGPTGTGATISGATTGSLVITNVRTADAAYYSCVISNPCGSVTTTATELRVLTASIIFEQPVDIGICMGGTGFFSVTTIDSPISPPRFQWYRYIQAGPLGFYSAVSNGITASGSTISGATSPMLTFSNTMPGDAGDYLCFVNSACGQTQTILVHLSVDTSPPIITTQPADSTTCPAGPAQFTVVASPAANGPYTYQWQRQRGIRWINLADGPSNGCGLQLGTHTDTLTFTGNPNLSPFDNGFYRCVVTNACGSTVSDPAYLSVCPGDFNCDGGVDFGDSDDFFAAWSGGDESADMNCDGGVDQNDVDYFFDFWSNGC